MRVLSPGEVRLLALLSVVALLVVAGYTYAHYRGRDCDLQLRALAVVCPQPGAPAS